MKYTVHSAMMNEMTPSSSRLLRHAALCRAWRGLSWLLLPFCYLGALLAPAVVLSIPFQVFHNHQVSPFVFWVTTGAMSALVLWVFCRAVSSGFRSFRHGVIHIEAIVMSLALLLAIVVIPWAFPPK
jgi:hypothetical protein